MIYSLLVLAPPASGRCAATAAQFALAAIRRGHRIHRAFFLDQGTLAGAKAVVFPQDEADPLAPWIELSEQHGVDLVLCISSALRWGILDEEEAERHEKSASTAHPAFSVSGLGQLVDAAAHSDRLLTFGG
jgi:tRNA 2-thiouridine synthesizing protein D